LVSLSQAEEGASIGLQVNLRQAIRAELRGMCGPDDSTCELLTERVSQAPHTFCTHFVDAFVVSSMLGSRTSGIPSPGKE
jgi:hypothetical protein